MGVAGLYLLTTCTDHNFADGGQKESSIYQGSHGQALALGVIEVIFYVVLGWVFGIGFCSVFYYGSL